MKYLYHMLLLISLLAVSCRTQEPIVIYQDHTRSDTLVVHDTITTHDTVYHNQVHKEYEKDGKSYIVDSVSDSKVKTEYKDRVIERIIHTTDSIDRPVPVDRPVKYIPDAYKFYAAVFWIPIIPALLYGIWRLLAAKIPAVGVARSVLRKFLHL